MQKRERRIRMNWLDKRQPLVLQKDQGLSRSYLEYCEDLIAAVVRLQVSNWLLKITGKIALETNKELSKFNPNCKNAKEMAKGAWRTSEADMLREACVLLKGWWLQWEECCWFLPLSLFLASEETLGLLSFIYSSRKCLSFTYLYWVSLMSYLLKEGGSKEGNSPSICWSSLRTKSQMQCEGKGVRFGLRRGRFYTWIKILILLPTVL